MLKSPCYKCEERHESCHSHCEKYLEFARQTKELHKQHAKAKRYEDDYLALATRRRRGE